MSSTREKKFNTPSNGAHGFCYYSDDFLILLHILGQFICFVEIYLNFTIFWELKNLSNDSLMILSCKRIMLSFNNEPKLTNMFFEQTIRNSGK